MYQGVIPVTTLSTIAMLWLDMMTFLLGCELESSQNTSTFRLGPSLLDSIASSLLHMQKHKMGPAMSLVIRVRCLCKPCLKSRFSSAAQYV